MAGEVDRKRGLLEPDPCPTGKVLAYSIVIGKTLGHYRILHRLGAGGMGEVYAAEDTRLKRHVALKVLPPEVTGDLASRDRFQREAQAIAALDHPNIVAIHSIEAAPRDDGSGEFQFFTMQPLSV